jgi:dTDP-4-dehydrorhamnose 3,5-epimerase-like enzyme
MINNCYTFNLETFHDARGSLSVIENNPSLPFEIQRLYYLYKTHDQSVRGVHAHKKLQQIIIPFSGEFEILLDDGLDKKTYFLNDPAIGLYVCPMIWRELKPIGNGGVCAVLASRKYEEHDYIHSYSDFISMVSKA